MALSANTANVQILVDSATRTVVKLWLHQEATGDETDVLKVNAATLSYRTLILNTATVPGVPVPFVPGEKVTGGTSGAVGYVLSFEPGKLNIVRESGTFTTEDVTGDRMNTTITVSSITTPDYLLDIESVWYSVVGSAKVSIDYQDGAGYAPALIVAGNGYYSKNAMATGNIPTNAAAPTGSIYVSTYGVQADGGYTLILELKKIKGFNGRPVY